MTGDILFLAHRLPYPPNRGDKIRSWHILNALGKLAPVHVAALVDDPADWDHARVIEAVASSISLAPRAPGRAGAMLRALLSGRPASVEACASAALSRDVAALLGSGRIAAIYAFSGQMAQFVPADWRGGFLMDFVDADSAKFAQQGEQGGFAGLAHRIEARRLLAFERETAARAGLSLFVSAAEAELFLRTSGMPTERIEVLENGVDLRFFDPDVSCVSPLPPGGPAILFTGQMDYPPNAEAVCAFAEKVLPRIQAQLPDVRFVIAGRAPLPEVRALAGRPGVIVTGAVEDMRPWLASAAAVVAPLSLARGVQNKVLEAMAMAKPVVASPSAAQGIDATPGQELLVADGPEDQARSLIALLVAPERAQSIGAAARRRVEVRYGWEARLAPLGGLIERAGGRR